MSNTISYGEPWKEGTHGTIWSAIYGRAILDSEPYEGNYWTDSDTYQARARAVQCVNSCAGVADPAAAIQAAKDALASAIRNFRGVPHARDCVSECALALSQLNPAHHD